MELTETAMAMQIGMTVAKTNGYRVVVCGFGWYALVSPDDVDLDYFNYRDDALTAMYEAAA